MTSLIAIKHTHEYYNTHLRFYHDKKRTYSKYSREAALLLGQQIRLGRKRRRWSEAKLAERGGLSRRTLQKIEAGEMTPAIGLVFEVAVLVGIPLFEQNGLGLSASIDLTQSKIALLPQRIRAQTKVADDDF